MPTRAGPLPRRSQVLDDLVRARPLVRRNDEVDIATAAAIQRMIGDARRVYAELQQLIAPRHRGGLILERADRLPSVKPRIADGHRRIFGDPTEEAKATHPDQGNRALLRWTGLADSGALARLRARHEAGIEKGEGLAEELGANRAGLYQLVHREAADDAHHDAREVLWPHSDLGGTEVATPVFQRSRK